MNEIGHKHDRNGSLYSLLKFVGQVDFPRSYWPMGNEDCTLLQTWDQKPIRVTVLQQNKPMCEIRT